MRARNLAPIIKFSQRRAPLSTRTTTIVSGQPQAPREEVRRLYWPPPAPRCTASVSIADLGEAEFGLRYPLTVVLDEYVLGMGETEFIASWPEVEVWSSARTKADALNGLKDEIVRLRRDLLDEPDEGLGKLPRRWKRSLAAVLVRREKLEP